MQLQQEFYFLSLSIFIAMIFLFSINNVYAESLILQNPENKIQYDVELIKSETTKKFYGNDNLVIIFLRDGKFMKIVGNVDGTRTLLFGQKTSENNDMASYNLKGKIRGITGIKGVSYTATFGNIPHIVTEEPIISNQQHKQLGKINLAIQSYSHVYKGEYFRFYVKTYDASLNPKDDFNQHFGYLGDVNISLKIIDPVGKMVKEFNGTTNKKNGFYEDRFIVPPTYRTASYSVIINATKDNYLSDSEKIWLHILEPIIKTKNCFDRDIC